jgi:hypothetical protein
MVADLAGVLRGVNRGRARVEGKIEMRERRVNTEATEDSRDSKTANGRVPKPDQGSRGAIEGQSGLQGGSESTQIENSVRASGARALKRDVIKASTRALPPRPGNFPPIPKVGSWSRATKEQSESAPSEAVASTFQAFRSEPPSGSTRAYNQAELAKLLNAADCLPSSLPPAPGDLDETNRLDTAAPNDCEQVSAMASWPQPVDSLFPQLRDMAHNEEATTAYLKLSPQGLLDETVSLEDGRGFAAATLSERAVEVSPTASAEELAMPTSISASQIESALAELRRQRRARRRLKRLQTRARRRVGWLIRASVMLSCVGLSAVIWVASPLGAHSRARASLHQSVVRLGAWLGPQNASAGAGLVQLDISADPPFAQIRLDGQAASNPVKLAYPADTRTHELSASAPGYRTRTLRVPFDRGVTVVLGLSPNSVEPNIASQ